VGTQSWNWISFRREVQAGSAGLLERFDDIRSAIAREKQIKGLLRIKKIALIVSMNPTWSDLSQRWYERHRYQPASA